MGCCSPEAQEPKGAHLTPYEERGCTDVLLLLMFLASWVASVIVFITAAGLGGNPEKIVNGVDTYGRVCGSTSTVENRPVAIWPDLTNPEVKYCAESCDETIDNTQQLMMFPYESTDYAGYCIPDQLVELVNISLSANFTTSNAEESDSLMGGSAEDLTRAIGDLYSSWWVVFISVFIALFCAFLYAKGLKVFGGCMVYTGFGLILLMGVLLAYALVSEAEDQRGGEYDDYADGMMYTGYVVGGITILAFFLLIFLRKRVELAIEIVKEAGTALVDMKMLIFFPIIPALFGAAYAIYWLFVSLYIFSVSDETPTPWEDTLGMSYGGEDGYYGNYCANIFAAVVANGNVGGVCTGADLLSPNGFGTWEPEIPHGEPNWADRTEYLDLVWNRDMEPYFAFHFFHLLWVVQFLIYFNYMVVAGGIAKWYFIRENEREEKLGSKPVTDACCLTTRYHLGSIAFGSLIIAIIQFIRACVKYIEEKSKGANGEQNKLQKAMFCCIQCCLKCVQCCMDKISKNAYCWIAIWGDSYLHAACSSFQLIWANMARAVIVNVVGDFLLFIGKIVVALSTTAICGFIIQGAVPEVNSLILPCVVIFILALMIAHLFMVEFDTTIDTIFMCFLVDEKFNKDTAMFASDELQKILGIDSHHFEESKKAQELTNVATAEQKE